MVLVDVWASWCAGRGALPAWTELRTRIGTERFEVVGLSVADEREPAVAFMGQLATGLPMVWDGQGDLTARFPVRTSKHLGPNLSHSYWQRGYAAGHRAVSGR